MLRVVPSIQNIFSKNTFDTTELSSTAVSQKARTGACVYSFIRDKLYLFKCHRQL